MINFKANAMVSGLSEKRPIMLNTHYSKKEGETWVTVPCSRESLLFPPIFWKSHCSKLVSFSQLVFFISQQRCASKRSFETCNKRLFKANWIHHQTTCIFFKKMEKGNRTLTCNTFLMVFWRDLLFFLWE